MNLEKRQVFNMSSIWNTSQIVHQILIERPETRGSDELLFYAVHKKLIRPNARYRDVIYDIRTGKLPPFESIRRSRQKVQEKYPELKSPNAQHHRQRKQAEYREYARW